MLWTALAMVCLTTCVEKQPESEVANAAATASQSSSSNDNNADPELYQVKAIDLLPAALGKFERNITTSSSEAQDFFNQGIQLKYAFAVNESASSFREAQKLDPDCAMCFWGEAWALGSYLNGAMSESKSPVALAAIQKAAELASNATEVEQALITAMTGRYIEDYVRSERRIQDSIFALAMEEVYQKFPDDLDVATVYAEALFLLEPRRGTREMDDPGVMKIHDVLEKVLAVDIEHPGACHLYIHATESTNQPQLGESCADYLGNSIPGASHINHMPSHTWNEVGRWGESVRANLQAWHSDQKSKIGEGIAIYPSHNLHMLLYAASFDGQGAIAIQAGKDYAKSTGNTMYHVLTLTRFGRFDEVLPIEDRPTADVAGGFWDFCQGYARLKTGEADFAGVYLDRILATADTSKASFRFHPAKQLLGVVGAILEGEIFWQEGNLNQAIQSFQRGVNIEDGMAYDEPEPLPFDARHWLGAALLEAGRFADAEKVYRDELADHPHNGWSYFGLIAALKAQSKNYDAEQAKLDDSWARSDTWLRGSKY